MKMLFTIKTVVGRENIVIDNVATKARQQNIAGVKAFIHPEEIKGYVFVEGDIKDIEVAVQDIPHVRGLIKKGIPMEQVERYMQPKTVVVELSLGDILEVVGGPFKGEKVDVLEVAAAPGQTRPPPRFSEATLLSAMEGAGKLVEDEK